MTTKKITIQGIGLLSYAYRVKDGQLSPRQMTSVASLDLGSSAERHSDGSIVTSEGLLILADGRVRWRQVSSDPRIYTLDGKFLGEQDTTHFLLA